MMPKRKTVGYSDFYKTPGNSLTASTPKPGITGVATPSPQSAFRSRIEREEEDRKKKAIKRRLELRTR